MEYLRPILSCRGLAAAIRIGASPPGGFRLWRRQLCTEVRTLSCVAPREGGLFTRTTYRVCQFSAPALIGVTTAERTVFYAPGVGRRATVAVRGGTPSCVLGGWFAG
jgi:hypothetical protein